MVTPLVVDPVDLITTPPLLSPTQIVEESLPMSTSIIPTTSVSPYFQALPENLRTRVDKDIDLQDFINQIPSIFPIFQQLMVTRPIIVLDAQQQDISLPQIPYQPQSSASNPQIMG